MQQLIQLTVYTRNAKTIDPSIVASGFDVDDIISPIRFDSVQGKSYFTTRLLAGTMSGKSENNARIDYMVDETLAQIKALSDKLIIVTVVKINDVALSAPETYVFNTRRISGDLVQVAGNGTQFYYHEDGYPQPIKYQVSQSLPTIIASANVGGYTALTYAQLATNIATNTVIPGQHYLVTDRGDNGIFLHGVKTNQVSREGIRFMLVPKYYGIGSYNGYTWEGVWASNKTVSSGNKAIWGGLVWTNLTGAIGSATGDTTLDGTNWIYIPKTIGNFYEEKQFSILYDFSNDWIDKQWDDSGNEFGIDYITAQIYSLGFNVADVADWNMAANGAIDGAGSPFLFFGNKCMGVYNNAVSVYLNTTEGLIKNNANLLYKVSNNTVKGNISDNLNQGDIYQNTDRIISISALTSAHGGMTQDSLVTVGATAYVIDITGLTTLALPSYAGTGLIRNVKLTSTNSTETINTITGMPGVLTRSNIKFEVASGLTVTFIHNTGTNKPRCEGAINAVLNGTNLDWINFESPSTGVIRQENIGTY